MIAGIWSIVLLIYAIEFLFKALRYSRAYKPYKKATGEKLSKLNTIYSDSTALASGMPESKNVAHNLEHGHIYHHVFTFAKHRMVLLYYGHHLKPYIIQIPYSNIKKWSYYIKTYRTRNESQGITTVSYDVYCDIYMKLRHSYIELRDLDINKSTGSRFIKILNNKTNYTQQIAPSCNRMTKKSSVSSYAFVRDVLSIPQNDSDKQQHKQLKDEVKSNIGHKIDQSYYLNNYVPED